MGVADQIVASRFSSIDLSNKAPDTVFVEEELDHCFVSTRSPGYFKKIVEGEIDFIEGVPKAKRYLVYSISDEMMATY